MFTQIQMLYDVAEHRKGYARKDIRFVRGKTRKIHIEASRVMLCDTTLGNERSVVTVFQQIKTERLCPKCLESLDIILTDKGEDDIAQTTIFDAIQTNE